MLPWPISEIDIASHPPAPSYPGAPPLCRLDATYAGAGCVRVPRELRRLGEELQFGRHVSALPPVYTGGLSGGADRPVHVCVSVSVSAGRALQVTHLRGGCHVVRVRLGRRGRDLRLPAVADNSRYRATGRREHRDAGQLAPAPPPWRRRLEPPRGRGQQGRDLGCDAVLQDLPRALDLRRRPGARFVRAAPGSCAGAPGKRLQLSSDRLDLSRCLARAVPGEADL